MGDKKYTRMPAPGDVGNSFEEQDHILNYRPKIDFVEPPQEPFETPAEVEEDTLDSLRDRTQKAINGLDAVNKLINQTQQRIDNRVRANGGLTIKLDPVKDAATVAAMKRRFPNKTDPTAITYEDYKQALNCQQKEAIEPPKILATDLQAAKADPFRVSFGGVDNIHGENRAEISSPASSISPVDLEAFQKAGVLALFALLLPLIKKEDKLEIAQHLITVPHKPI